MDRWEIAALNTFITSGIFRRAACNRGFQGGVVLDYLADNFYVHANLWQMRGEVSYVFAPHELGFWFAAHLNSKTQTSNLLFEQNSVTWQATDQFNFFYRYTFANGSFGAAGPV